MLSDNKTLHYLRASSTDADSRYLITPVFCSAQGVFHSAYISTKANYAADPDARIYIFTNPRAAVEFVQKNIDTNYTWSGPELMIDNAPTIIEDFPGNYIVAAGKCTFPEDWVYPAPIGIYAADVEHIDFGKGYITEINDRSYTGSLATGYLTVVVWVKNGATAFSGVEEDKKLYECDYCGFRTNELTSTSDPCPKCGTIRVCEKCNYFGHNLTCPHCLIRDGLEGTTLELPLEQVPTVLRTPSYTELATLKTPVSLSLQFFNG